MNQPILEAPRVIHVRAGDHLKLQPNVDHRRSRIFVYDGGEVTWMPDVKMGPRDGLQLRRCRIENVRLVCK